MTETLLERANRFIEDGAHDGIRSTNPIDGSFHEIADGIGMVCAFSHVWSLATDAGQVLFDTSLEIFGPTAVDAMHGWKPDPVDTIVYTHGHYDHVGGAGAFVAAAAESGHRRPAVIGHENVPARFDRYDMTVGYNSIINGRQFGWDGVFELDWVRPDTTYRDDLSFEVGGTEIVLRHDRGETDDHTWAWIPDRKAIFSGDLVWWNFPNAGNPQKVQRYAADWAAALRAMIELGPELLCPAHGIPIEGRDRIAMVLDDNATALEGLVRDTLEMMNTGARLDDIIHSVTVPEELLAKPYLNATYDEPEFVVRNIWRLYGGWYDGDPARLKPPPAGRIAAEVAELAGGPDALAGRALSMSDGGDHRLACQLVEWAAQAASGDATIHHTRAEIYRRRRDDEISLMARGIYGAAAAESEAIGEVT